MSAVQLQFRPRIVPTGQKLPWLQAREAVKDKGGLPSHPLLDDCLMRSEDWRSIAHSLPLLSSQVFVHPAKDGVFKRGESITDREMGLVFPAEHIPADALDTPKTGLLVLPGEVKPVADGLVAIESPASILVVHGLVEQNGGRGKAHEASRLPLEVSAEEARCLAWGETRFLWKKEKAGVGSVARGVDVFDIDYRRNVNASVMWFIDLGVASVAYDILLEGGGLKVEGVTLADMRRFAAGDLPEALHALPGELREAARQLAQAL